MPKHIHKLVGQESHTNEMNRLSISKCNCIECGTYGTYRFKGGFDLPTANRIASSYVACDGMSDPQKHVAELIALAHLVNNAVDPNKLSMLSAQARSIVSHINR